MISVQVLSYNSATPSAPNSSTIGAFMLDGTGNALSSTSGSLNVNITGGAASGAVIDQSTFTAGTSTFQADGGVYNDALAALTSGQQGEARYTAYRGKHVNLRNSSGAEVGISAAPVYTSTILTAGAAAIGSVTVSNFPATQPVSGTVSLGAGAAAIGSVTVSNFPATQPVSGTVSLGAGAAAIGSVTVSNFPATQPVSGTVAVSAITGALPAGANTIGNVGLSAGATVIVAQPTTATLTQVTGSTTSQTLVAANASRKGVIINNNTNKLAYVAFGATATATAYTYQINSGNSLELNANLAFAGAISVISPTGVSGAFQVTDLS